ncbi:MAG: hypothetical protein DMF97_12655 [Acidobacteria bacterium]|nr:MAG: hypothetical protein DMF97_12655 [Acidobacteriota bacterium]
MNRATRFGRSGAAVFSIAAASTAGRSLGSAAPRCAFALTARTTPSPTTSTIESCFMRQFWHARFFSSTVIRPAAQIDAL